MKKQNINEPVTLNDEQAVDAIYDLLGKSFPDKAIQREPLKIQEVSNNLGFINPGPKNINHLLLKLDREIRSKSDAENNIEMGEIINRDYKDCEGDLFDNLRDWSRFAIIIPDYASAPAIVGHFLAEFGGQIDYHERPGYQAIHQHTSYKDVNLEFQFHTVKHAELKKATDIFYHQYNNIVVPMNSRIENEKRAIEAQMNEYCQMVYNRSDFQASLPAVKALVSDYQDRAPKVQKKKLKHFCEYARKADLVQSELAAYLPTFLGKYNEMQNTKIEHVEKI